MMMVAVMTAAVKIKMAAVKADLMKLLYLF